MIRTIKQGLCFLSSLAITLLERCMSLHPSLSSLYYGIFSTAMRQEHYSVLMGKHQYKKNLVSAKGTSFLLRRNTHRLEKGLIMRPRRAVFGKEYIQETVDAYLKCYDPNGESLQGELKWAHDVLTEYFAVTGSDPVIDAQRARFQVAQQQRIEPPSIPYQRDLSAKPISFDEFYALSRLRRSVRWFLPKPVPRELVDNAMLVAAQAPSACNRQPFHFRIYDEPTWVEKVASIPMGTKGFAHQFPMIIVVTGQLEAYFDERDRHVIYIDASLATMAFLYGLETQGLSSCVINWPEINEKEKKMAKLINLKASERAILLIAVGWPDPEALVPYSQKKSLDQLRSYPDHDV